MNQSVRSLSSPRRLAWVQTAALLTIAVLCSWWAPQVRADIVLVSSDLFENLGGQSGFFAIDSQTGELLGDGVIEGVSDITHYAFSSNANSLFAFAQGSLVLLKPASVDPDGGLHGLKRHTLVGSVVGAVGVARIEALTHDPTTDSLFAMSQANELVRIDPATGTGTTMGASDPDLLDLAFDRQNNQLVGLRKRAGFGPDLVSIDRDTGVATRLRDLATAPLGVNAYSGVAYDQGAERLSFFSHRDSRLTSDPGDGKLIGLSPTDGAEETIADVAALLYQACREFDVSCRVPIAIVPVTALPEPTGAALAACGVIALTSPRRRDQPT